MPTPFMGTCDAYSVIKTQLSLVGKLLNLQEQLNLVTNERLCKKISWDRHIMLNFFFGHSAHVSAMRLADSMQLQREMKTREIHQTNGFVLAHSFQFLQIKYSCKLMAWHGRHSLFRNIFLSIHQATSLRGEYNQSTNVHSKDPQN